MKAKIWNKRKWFKTSKSDKEIFDYCKRLLLQSKFTILNKMQYTFKPQGFTCIFLLAESHLAVHTFPEKNKIYIELSSCNKKKQKQFFKLINKQWFKY